MDLPDLARSRAILIGNGSYVEHPHIPDLPGAQACVQVMTELLTGPLCGWPTERIIPLVDLAVPSELAVRVWEAVRDAEDVLLVYYVGHGMRTFDGQLALALAGTRPHPETLRHTAMLYPELASILRGAPAPTKLVILDCCHAELGHRANYVFQSADLAEAYPVDGLYFIGASARDAKAKAPADGGLTYFTDAFVTTVTTGIPYRPPTLRLDQIFLELRARLLRANLPEPVEAGTRGAHQFPFARNAAPQEFLLDPDAEIARLRRETAEAEARERALHEEHARELQRLRGQSHITPPTGTTTPENLETPASPSTAIVGTTHPDPPAPPHSPPGKPGHKPAIPSDLTYRAGPTQTETAPPQRRRSAPPAGQPRPSPTLQGPPVRPRRLAAWYAGGLLVAAGCFIAANLLPLGGFSAYSPSGIKVAHVTFTFNLIHPFMWGTATGPDAAKVYVSWWLAPLIGVGTAVSLAVALAVLFHLLRRPTDPLHLKARIQSAYGLSMLWGGLFAILLVLFIWLSRTNVADNSDNPADNLSDRATVQAGTWLLFAASAIVATTLQQTAKRLGLPRATKPRQPQLPNLIIR